jgi:predicted membrane-bound spermidine synthase
MASASVGPIEPNQLNNQVLVRYFEEEWRKVIR